MPAIKGPGLHPSYPVGTYLSWRIELPVGSCVYAPPVRARR